MRKVAEKNPNRYRSEREQGAPMNTAELLDHVRKAQALPSDYALAAKLGVSPQRVSHFRNGREIPGDKAALHLAQLAQLDPGYVLACLHAERAKRPAERKAWQALARKAGIAAMLLITVGFVLLGQHIDGLARAETSMFGVTHYAQLTLAGLLGAMLAAFAVATAYRRPPRP
jgi:hypothetical protein